MVFANDQLLSREAYVDALQQIGVIWLPLEQAMNEHPELFQQYFMREEAILGGQKRTFPLRPLLDDQELDNRLAGGPIYWEGAVSCDQGRGYLELTGYDRAIRF